MIEVVVLKGPGEQAQGLIGMKPIPEKTFFVFPNIRPNTYFHSRGVLEKFDIVFIDRNGNPLLVKTIVPPDGIVKAPLGTDTVIEAKAGTFHGTGLGDAATCVMPFDVGFLFPTVVIATGVGLGIWGFKKKTAWGPIALGAGGSMIAAGLVIVVQKLFFPIPPPKA